MNNPQQKKKILVVAGTRPNFIKISQFKSIAGRSGKYDLRIVHTGQHYDINLADIFFSQLHIAPDYYLLLDELNPAARIKEIVEKLSDLLKNTFFPDLVMVVGDVDSTRAAAEAAHAQGIMIAHVESGLRSFDNSMPEETNRIIADTCSALHFVTEESGIQNLRKEGFPENSIFFCGNTMIDTLVAFSDKINSDPVLKKYALSENKFALVTLHRPSNVDTKDALSRSIELLRRVTENHTVIFPVHPRTKNKLAEFKLEKTINAIGKLILTEPLGYFAFQKLISTCAFIITDSGGIQEEATYRKKPCLTIRANTERPSTIITGSNTLVHFDLQQIAGLIDDIDAGKYKTGEIPPLWDGQASERIFQVLDRVL